MIGLEIHCQLTRLHSKLFCPCKADYRGMEPNSNTCPVCLGLPGTLPLLNSRAVRQGAALAISLNCTLPERLAFFRKNYFYPDLPKNYQITQFDAYGDTSIGSNGIIHMDDGAEIRIRRIQLEEDPGRLIYEGGSDGHQNTLVDYNRAGVPLLEIVTEPDFDSPRQARTFMNILADTVKNLGIADPHLDGVMRADGNVSVHGGSKVEIKNINSFHDLEKALHYEMTRQNSLHENNITIQQETRHWDDRRRITIPSRTKEAELDYRYFLEADIPWVVLDIDTMQEIAGSMPESTTARRDRYIKQYGIKPQVASALMADTHCCHLFEEALTPDTALIIANILTTDFMGVMDTREKRAASQLNAKHLSRLATLLNDNKITRAVAKDVLYKIAKKGGDIEDVLDAKGFDSSKLYEIISDVLKREPTAAAEARTKPPAINYLVGIVMCETRGCANPQDVLGILGELLNR